MRMATQNETLHSVRLLGGSTWNSASTPKSCQSYCENSVFVDAFFLQSAAPNVRNFVQAFQEVESTDPTLIDAIAYDSAKWILSITNTSQAKDRDALRKALLLSPPYQGVTGKLTFRADGEIERTLQVLTIQNKQIVSF